ncbi:solute carrier family 15 member 4-like [Acanthaster planci]|uniref:Solute carrier family 15 member 4-like n=1 Tax=Acanthaster planci TaxID=133434 RepID=A0A8B7Z0Z1_ACAPL|nr:solute carrier family 15 member 4-like [Acanthaster planci]XP_022099273.1 solute carrier family 15 member 4-like [Acanthaster planci]XP_022099274.1 solute carrier family 15 member 4-like [Acanthaster planci]
MELNPVEDDESKRNGERTASVEVDTPAPTKSFGFQRDRLGVVLCILFCELCERLTYYSVAGNLVLYCTNVLKFTSAEATTIALIFTGTSYFVPVIGGWIADTVAGKFNAILGAALIYCVGTTLLPIVSIDYTKYGAHLGLTNSQHRGFFLFSIAVIAIGTGGIKSNVGPFGAQQLDDLGEGPVKSFFNWFYWFINVGSAVSFSVVVYVQQNIGFDVGFAIPAISMILAIITLLIGRKWYRMRAPEGSVFTTVAKIIWEAFTRLRQPNTRKDQMTSWLDRAKQSFGGHFPDVKVNEVKALGRIVPVFLVIIFYWTVYVQNSTTFLLQGERMRLAYSGFTVPVAAINLVNIGIILVLIPFVDRVFYPFMARIGYPLTKLKRIGIGMVLIVLAMVLAAGIEFARKASIEEYGYFKQEVANKVLNASYLSVFAQIPQYTLIGASEVFTIITGLEFAYSESPESMQGVIMGLFLLTFGLGSYVGSLLVTIANAITSGAEWIPNEVNYGHLEYYFLLLATIMTLGFVCFLLISRSYVYVKDTELGRPPDSDCENSHRGIRQSNPKETTPLLSDTGMV